MGAGDKGSNAIERLELERDGMNATTTESKVMWKAQTQPLGSSSSVIIKFN
jgi:hypothetical protein